MIRRIADLARQFATELHKRYCDACHDNEARHFMPNPFGKGTVGLCNTCYAWRRKGRL